MVRKWLQGVSWCDASYYYEWIQQKKLNYFNFLFNFSFGMFSSILIKDKYKELNKNEDFQKISFSIDETEDLLNAYKEYYNNLANQVIKFCEERNIEYHIKEKTITEMQNV